MLGTVILSGLAAVTLTACSSGGGQAAPAAHAATEANDALVRACLVAMTDAQLASDTTPPCGCMDPLSGAATTCPVTPPMPPPEPPPPSCEPESTGSDPGTAITTIPVPAKIAPLAFYSYGTCGDPVDTCGVDAATGASKSGAQYVHEISDESYIGQVVVEPVSGTKQLALYLPGAAGSHLSLTGVPVPLVTASNTFADTTNPVTIGGTTYYTVLQVDTRPVGSTCVTSRC